MKYKESDVLCYNLTKRDNRLVRRYYDVWRRRNNIPYRCDVPSCIFHTEPLLWNGKELNLILDHISGNNKDNSPKNLRYLCPNCNSQQPTQGGKNIGRIQNESEIAYEVQHSDGRRDANVFPPTIRVMGIGKKILPSIKAKKNDN